MSGRRDFGPGYFGKAPSHGDFLHHGLDRLFVDPWDRWLSQGIGESRRQLGEDWLDLYLTFPVWRFAIGAGIAGPSPMAGVFLPSVDATGRYFPFTIATSLPDRTPPVALRRADHWYSDIEALARSVLAETFELDAFDQALEARAPPIERSASPANRRLAADDPMTAATLVHEIGAVIAVDYALLWTEGSKAVPGSVLLCQALPEKYRFAALLDGRFARWGWQDGEA